MTIFEKYSNIRGEIARLEDELKGVKESLVAELKTKDGERLLNDQGLFTLMTKKVYKYNTFITNMEKELKSAKAEHINTGVAELVTILEWPVMRKNKIEVGPDLEVVEKRSESLAGRF